MSDITPASSIPTVHLPNPLLAYFLNRFPSSSSPSPTTSSHGDDATDWRSRCLQVEQMLSDTQTELDEFTRASKELEEEMERDLERNENEKEQLRARVSKLEGDRDDWKTKFVNLQHTHNATTSSLQRELDATRQSVQIYKDQVRELEMGNDDLERNERQASSSLADVEMKYARALEEKILLEHELQDKVALEEASQRLRDELRDVNLEVAVLKDQVTQLKTLPERPHTLHRDSSSSLPFTPPDCNEESLLHQEPPDLSLSELGLLPSPSSRPISMSSLQSRLSQEVFCDDRLPASPVSVASFSGSRPNSTMYRERPSNGTTTTPTQTHFLNRALSPTASSGASSSSTRLPTPRTRRIAPSPQFNSPATPRIPVPVFRPLGQRSRGVQIVSDMRQRLRTLEQNIQSTMPRMPSRSIAAGSAALRRAPSRTGGGGTGSSVGNVRTPKGRPVPNNVDTGAKDSGSPWVLIADDGAGNTTLRGPIDDSPDQPPRLPPVPTISPFTTGTVSARRPVLDSSGSGIRPPSRTAGLRAVSAMGRPLPSLASHVAAANGNYRTRSPFPPPTAFPTGLSSMDQQEPSPIQRRPSSRIAQFTTSTSTAPPPPRRSSEQHERDRSTTPTFLSKASPAVSDVLRRAHTMSSPTKPTLSSPTKPKAHVTAGVLPRQRKDSQHQIKGAHVVGSNTRDAGVTPGKVKQRSATSPIREPPPPLPALPTDMRGGRVQSGNILGKSKLGGGGGLGGSSRLGQSRIGRPSGGHASRKSIDDPTFGGMVDEDEEDVTIKIKPGRGRSGTSGSAR